MSEVHESRIWLRPAGGAPPRIPSPAPASAPASATAPVAAAAAASAADGTDGTGGSVAARAGDAERLPLRPCPPSPAAAAGARSAPGRSPASGGCSARLLLLLLPLLLVAAALAAALAAAAGGAVLPLLLVVGGLAAAAAAAAAVAALLLAPAASELLHCLCRSSCRAWRGRGWAPVPLTAWGDEPPSRLRNPCVNRWLGRAAGTRACLLEGGARPRAPAALPTDASITGRAAGEPEQLVDARGCRCDCRGPLQAAGW